MSSDEAVQEPQEAPEQEVPVIVVPAKKPRAKAKAKVLEPPPEVDEPAKPSEPSEPSEPEPPAQHSEPLEPPAQPSEPVVMKPRAKRAPRKKVQEEVAPPPPPPEEPVSLEPPEAPKPKARAPRKPAQSAEKQEDHSMPQGILNLHNFGETIRQIHAFKQAQKRETYRKLLEG